MGVHKTRAITLVALVGATALIMLGGLDPRQPDEAGNDGAGQPATDKVAIVSPATAVETLPDDIDILLVDLGIPQSDHERYRLAIGGVASAQEALRDRVEAGRDTQVPIYELVGWGDTKTVDQCMFDIARLYYNGWEDVLSADREKAFTWLLSAAEKGHYEATLSAGEMLLLGDGVPEDKAEAFKLYQQAQAIKATAEARLRVADCYYHGDGTAEDREKAFELHLNLALEGDVNGLERLVSLHGMKDEHMLYKALASLDFRDNYWNVAYGEPGSYTPSRTKQLATDWLVSAWAQGSDPAAEAIQAEGSGNRYFSAGFLGQMKRLVYSYAFYGFTAENLCPANIRESDVDYTAAEGEDEGYAPYGAGFGMGLGLYQYRWRRCG